MYVRTDAKDAIGQMLATEIREQVRRSSGYRLEISESTATLILTLRTLRLDVPGVELSTFSAVITWRHRDNSETYCDSTVGYLGEAGIPRMASSLVARLDETFSVEMKAMYEALVEMGKKANAQKKSSDSRNGGPK